MKKTFEIQGEALRLFYDFLKYAEMEPEKMARIMNYDLGGFKKRTKLLAEAYDKAERQDDDY